MLLVGSFAAASAEANQGPFWYHRAVGAQGKGTKLTNGTSVEVRGGGGVAVFKSKLAGAEIELTSSQVQIKGLIFNNALQGQARLEFAYNQPTAIKPSSCTVRVASNNVVKVFGHQVWTYNNELKQLTEQPVQNQKPQWLFLGQELQQGAGNLPTGVPFTSITFSGALCPISGQGNVIGSIVAAVKPEQLGAFSRDQVAESLLNGSLLHFWNGASNITGASALKFNNEEAKLVQTGKVSVVSAEEVGLWGD
jgi:hypothetical protein